MTQRDAYLIPRLDEFLEFVADYSQLTKFDLYSEYHQLYIAEECVPLLAFSCEFDYFEQLYMLFGPTTVPATFQYIIDAECYNYARVYFDNIVIVSKIYHEYVEYVYDVLKVITNSQFNINANKSILFTKKLKTLEFILSVTFI